MVCIVYYDAFDGGAVVFDRVVQPTEFEVLGCREYFSLMSKNVLILH